MSAGRIEQRRAVAAAVLVVAVRPLGAGPPIIITNLPSLVNFRIMPSAPLVDAQAEPFGLPLRAVAAEIDEAVVVDEDAVLAGRPDAAVLDLALVRIGRAAPGAQQLSVRIELHDRRRGQAAVAKRPVGTRIAQRVDGLSVLGLVVAPVSAASSLVSVRGRW